MTIQHSTLKIIRSILNERHPAPEVLYPAGKVIELDTDDGRTVTCKVLRHSFHHQHPVMLVNYYRWHNAGGNVPSKRYEWLELTPKNHNYQITSFWNFQGVQMGVE